MIKKPNIYLGVGMYGNLYPDTQACLMRLIYSGLAEFQLVFRHECNVHEVRNYFVAEFLESHHDYLMFIDRDMVFSVDNFARLLTHIQNPEVDVVGGLYIKTTAPFLPTVYRLKDINKENYEWDNLALFKELETANGLVEVDGVATGFMMIKKKVLYPDAGGLSYPWFSFIDPQGQSTIGSDITFCIKAKRAGFRIFVATDVQVGHIGSHVYTFDNWKDIKREILPDIEISSFKAPDIVLNQKKSISIIIPIKNAAKVLQKNLEALIPQLKGIDSEIIIVDHNSTDGLQDVISKFRRHKTNHGKLNNIKVVQRGDIPFGFCSANNEGINAATKEIIFLMGADIVLSSNCIASHLTKHDKPNLIIQSRRDNLSFRNQISPDYRLRYLYENPDNITWDRFIGTAFSFNREWVLENVAEDGNAFDPRFEPDWGFDDNEFAYRFTKAGGVIKFDPDSRGIHQPHPRSIPKDRSANIMKFLKKYPEMKGKI